MNDRSKRSEAVLTEKIWEPFERTLRDIGENMGERLFDALQKGNPNREARTYRDGFVEQFGHAFVAYILIVYVWPLFWLSYNCLMGVLESNDSTLPQELAQFLYWTPNFDTGLIGSGITLVGGLYLAAGLFDNPIVEEADKGKTIALQYAGALFLVTGYVVQNNEYFSGSLIETVPDIGILSLIVHIVPFIILPVLGTVTVFLYRKYPQQYVSEEQTTFDDEERWGR